MAEIGKKNPAAKLEDLGIKASNSYWNLSSEELTKKTIELGQGTLTDMGALAVNTGKFHPKINLRFGTALPKIPWIGGILILPSLPKILTNSTLVS
jgi:hypothetical protein